MAWSTPTSRSDGYVVPATEWNQNTVDNPNALRSGAIAIASQAANDVLYASSATQLARLAAGTAGQVLTTQGAGSAPIWSTVASPYSICNGRLTLTSGMAVTTSDVTAAGTLYWTPYGGNQIALYSGSAWVTFAQAELSVSVPAVANQVYDVFVDYNSGTPALTLTAWTNDTTRATALTTQNGVLVLTGSTGKRYVGTVRTVTASQLNDSAALRHVWNYYNRVSRPLRVLDTTNSWTYSTAAFRQANNSAANQVSVVVGVAEDAISVQVQGLARNDGSGVNQLTSIGEDSTTAKGANVISTNTVGVAANSTAPGSACMTAIPAIGYHYYAWLEYDATGSGTTTWIGDNGGTSIQTGIMGVWRA